MFEEFLVDIGLLNREELSNLGGAGGTEIVAEFLRGIFILRI